MTARQEQVQAVGLQNGALPKPDHVGLLAQQIAKSAEGLTTEERQVLANALVSGKPDAAVARELTQPHNVTAQRAFIEKFKITELDSSQVALTLPAGTSRIEFLKEAQALSIALHASTPEKYQAYNAVYPKVLEDWELRRGFTKAAENDLSLKIDGNVKGSTYHNRKEQKDKGWNDVTQQDLAVAHTAFYLLTGKDLFEGNTVRAARDALHFSKYGLRVHYCHDSDFYFNLSASRSLPDPN